MKNIHVLPKNIFNQIGVDHYGKTPTQIKIGEFLINKGIYITSNEEIKRYGEYYLDIDTKEIKTSFENMGKYLSNEKKIVLTDNEDLIKDGVQAIDDEFLEWFVKNPSCEWVEVKPLMVGFVDDEPSYYENMYEIIIPSEEPKEQTIEEIVETLDTKQLDELDIFLKGAQWKEEQDKKKYTEEEVEQIAKDAYEMGRKNLLIGVFNKWFNGIKKK